MFANSRVTLVKHSISTMLVGLPKSCKGYGNGVPVVAAKVNFYTTTLICSEGEGKQSVGPVNPNRSDRYNLSESSAN